MSVCEYVSPGGPDVLSADQLHPFVLGEVHEILDVERGERQVADQQQAAIQLSLLGGPAAALGIGRQNVNMCARGNSTRRSSLIDGFADAPAPRSTS